MNKIIVIGNLGRDPEMRDTTNAGEKREEVEWFNCQAFGKLAGQLVRLFRLKKRVLAGQERREQS